MSSNEKTLKNLILIANFLCRLCRKLILTEVNNTSVRNLSNKSALISKTKREYYLRTYPTTVVEPDGSSYTIRYQEPRRIIKLPLDVTTLTPEELTELMYKRKPKQKVDYVVQEKTDSFEPDKYVKFLKKKK